jgi:Tfp pilus assembly protein PilE
LLIVLAIVGILAAISTGIYIHARVQGNEASAIATMAAVNQAQFAFAQACGNQRYADLAVDPLVKSGYQFVLAGTPLNLEHRSCLDQGLLESYSLTADPLHPGASGARFFATNTDRAVFTDTASFAGNMPETGPPSHGAELK